jgi:2-keto-3-deoxy-L-rhamnonate aldolase RhmA
MNPFRQMLRHAGAQAPVGTWLMSASPLVAEALGHAGFDWVVVDMEHAPLEVPGVVSMLQALSGSRAVAVVRTPWNDAVMIKRVLDAGATTLLVPFVQSADEARAAVAATRYPPLGVRGMAGMSRASKFGTADSYLQRANDGIGVIVQLESPTALAALEDIAAVPGVDALFIGPADLSGTMGLPGRPDHPAVAQAVADAVRRAHAVGKPIGIITATPESLAQHRALGFDFLALDCDLGLMMRAAQESLAALRRRSGDHVHSLSTGTRAETPT